MNFLQMFHQLLGQGPQTEGGNPTQIVGEVTDEKNENMYKFNLFQFKEVGPIEGPSPKPRSGHRIVYHKGKIYSFGGFNPAVDGADPDLEGDEYWQDSKPLFKELWELNLTTRRWTKSQMKGEIPEQLASHTAVAHPCHPGVMLVYGGTGAPFGLTTSNTVVACQLETQQFSKLAVADGPGQPMPLYGQAVITDQEQGLFYTVGGTSGFNYFMDVNVLDLRSSPPAWQSLYRLSGLDDEPEARYRHELCLHHSKLYVLGGGTSFSADRFEELPTFDLAEKRWTYTRTKPDALATIDNSDDGYPEARRCHGTVQVGNHAFVVGGYDGDDVFGDAWRLDLVSLQWRRLRIELPLPVYFHAVTVSGEGKMVMFGGVDSIEQNTRTNKVFTAWLTVPSLRAMAWEAVCHYTPHIAKLSKAALLAEGVPSGCLETLKSPAEQAAVCG